MVANVVDASVVAAFLFDEPDADRAAALLRGARLVAPALLTFELANVCAMKARRSPDHREALNAAFALRARLEIENIAVDHDGVVRLAQETGLTAYDASYLWLARTLSAPLLTFDQRLATVSGDAMP